MEKGKNKKVIAAGLLVMSLTMACNSALAPILAEVCLLYTSIQIEDSFDLHIRS